jgi:hypothetical protein
MENLGGQSEQPVEREVLVASDPEIERRRVADRGQVAADGKPRRRDGALTATCYISGHQGLSSCRQPRQRFIVDFRGSGNLVDAELARPVT